MANLLSAIVAGEKPDKAEAIELLYQVRGIKVRRPERACDRRDNGR